MNEILKAPLILLGGGNSVKEGIEKELWNRIQGQRIWSLNYAFITMPYLPTREIWMDLPFFDRNVVALQKLQEQGVEMVTKEKVKYTELVRLGRIKTYKVNRLREKYNGRNGIKKNFIYVGGMGLTGIFALSLAVAEEYESIFLLGYDFGTSSLNETRTHYYQDDIQGEHFREGFYEDPKLGITYSTGVGRPIVYRTPQDKVKKEVEDFAVYLPEIDKGTLKITNVSLNSNIPYFERISYDEFFERLETMKG